MGKVHRKKNKTNVNKALKGRNISVRIILTGILCPFRASCSVTLVIHRALPNVYILHPFRAINYRSHYSINPKTINSSTSK